MEMVDRWVSLSLVIRCIHAVMPAAYDHECKNKDEGFAKNPAFGRRGGGLWISIETTKGGGLGGKGVRSLNMAQFPAVFPEELLIIIILAGGTAFPFLGCYTFDAVIVGGLFPGYSNFRCIF